jgi:hypothetical protein
MLRLLLRAAPTEDPAALRGAELRRRRGAMYLLFSAAALPGQRSLDHYQAAGSRAVQVRVQVLHHAGSRRRGLRDRA